MNRTNASKFIAERLSKATRDAYIATANVDDKDDGDHAVFKKDGKQRHLVHKALKAVHKAVFENNTAKNFDEAKAKHSAIVDLADPANGDDSEKKTNQSLNIL